jgi:hypothetical protein
MSSPVVVSRIQNRQGTQAQFNGPNAIYPQNYDGVGGFGSIPGYTPEAYPEVLLPGEIGLCLDTRNIYIGNLNGEFVEISSSQQTLSSLSLLPLTIDLPPAASYTVIPELSYLATPFMSVLYSLTDNSSDPDWNTVGTSFSRNAELKITAVANFTPVPAAPFPPSFPIEVADEGSEVNTTSSTISFSAAYNGSEIEISYIHNFSSSLKFSSSTITWLPY